MAPELLAGEIATQDETVCVEGVLVTVKHQVTGVETSAYSGTFGDFHVDVDVDAPGFYSVTFWKDGFKRKTIANIELRESKSLDVVKLRPTID